MVLNQYFIEGKVNVYGAKGERIWDFEPLIGERLWDER